MDLESIGLLQICPIKNISEPLISSFFNFLCSLGGINKNTFLKFQPTPLDSLVLDLTHYDTFCR